MDNVTLAFVGMVLIVFGITVTLVEQLNRWWRLPVAVAWALPLGMVLVGVTGFALWEGASK
jgi:hypothetical protein